MPCVRIATGSWAAGRAMALIEAVQAALVSAFQIPDGDRDIVLDLYDANRRIVPVGALHTRRDHRHRCALAGRQARSVQGDRGQPGGRGRSAQCDADRPDRT